MLGGQENPRHPDPLRAAAHRFTQPQMAIQLLVNYWEIRPTAMAARLDELLASGVTSLATFVPWQALESDISHQFMRLLHAVTERKMNISLIVTPEVGIHYAYSGLPKDVINRAENAVQHRDKGPVTAHLAPNSFALPSLIAPEFTKRYYSFLSRIDNLLSELEKSLNRPIPHVTVVLTGSFWKYYRSPVASSAAPFGGAAGDFSPQAAVQYRQRLEDFYGQAEFNDPTPIAANRWKTQTLEPINQRWFYQQSEAVFRNRTIQLARKKSSTVQLSETELYTPEADPSLHYSYFLQAVSGRDLDFFRLSALIDEVAAFASMAGLSRAAPQIHWSGLGGFRNLSDQEKQFLILKSLLIAGGDGGGILVDEEQWLSLSKSFRSRAEAIARAISHDELRSRAQALYLVPHLWSGPGTFWRQFWRRVGFGARRVASLDWVARDQDARLLFVDPSMIVTREVLHRLTEWAGAGRTLVLPRSTLYTETARRQLEVLAAGSRRIEMNLGISYRVHPIREGKLVVYDIPETAILHAQDSPEWDAFLASVLSLAEVGQCCQVSDTRISLIPLERKDGSIGLFVLNGTHRPISVDLFFPLAVSVSELAVEASAVRQKAAAAEGAKDSPGFPSRSNLAKRFSLDVPQCGILPLAVDRIGGVVESPSDRHELNAADRLGSLSTDNAVGSASHELPGLDLSEENPPWN